ncbi:MAG TPA: flagellar hook assembly protein FlgD [Oxalicibacterium sp.]|uniref:flagellar hook assembly protein FlgD n=1 Tax=Oxalicibacterium sp. TaxID=2766525 RepID=UPI002CBC52CB|nr:flagellar hook assembly protein FlgD [Oxalicibacterium sp.]HWU99177.1 flagellar hook assembly protein FlgD [Oxalicibacterium sp.]
MASISNQLPQSVIDAMSPKTSTGKSDVDDIQDRFMTLLITQMQNQDPLNPMDNSQMTSQLAQLSTVTGIDKVNSTLQSLIGTYQSGQSMQAANLIGHGVLASGNQLGLADKQALAGVEFPQDVDQAQMVIKDKSGNVVHTIDLGAQSAGTVPLLWDGKLADGSQAPDGNYTFEVNASLNGNKVDVDELQFGMVTTVTTGPEGVRINVPGLGALDFSDIRQIL